MQEVFSPTSPLVNLAPFALILTVFYFLLVRPQQQKAKEIEEMLAGLRQGDDVGKIVKLNDKTLILEIASKVQIRVERDAVSQVQRLQRALEKAEEKS